MALRRTDLATRSEPKIVDPSPRHEAAQDEAKLRHLLHAMKPHQLRRDRPSLHATQSRPAISAEQSEAADKKRPFPFRRTKTGPGHCLSPPSPGR